MRKLTNEEVFKRLKPRNILPINEYTTAKDRGRFKCLKCGFEWEATFGAVISGNKTGCPKCAGFNKTLEDIEFSLKEKPFKFIDEYRGNNSKIKYKFKCNCGKEFEDYLSSAFTRKGGCGSCENVDIDKDFNLFHKSVLNSYNKFLGKLKELNYNLLSKYKNSSSTVEIECLKHDYRWKTKPCYVLEGFGICEKCKEELRIANKIKKQEKLFLNKINNDKFIKLVGDFKGLHVKTKFKCSTCQNEWETKPMYYYFYNSRCPKCKASKGELLIMEYLEDKNIRYKHEYIFNDLKGKKNRNYRFDFAILGPRGGVKALIEFDGIMHYKKKMKNQNLLDGPERDRIKSDFAKKKNIKLIRIPYWDINNIYNILNKNLKGVI